MAAIVPSEADLYELNLREKDARRTVLVGAVLLALGIGILVTWLLIIQVLVLLVPDPRINTGLFGAGAFLSVAGGYNLTQGLSKHREWRQRRAQLNH